MSVIFLLVGSALLIADRVLKKSTALIMKEQLTYFIYYFRPSVQRRQFFGIIFLVTVFSTAFDYLIFPEIDLWSHLLLPLVLVLGMYLLIFLLAVFDRFAAGRGSVDFNFFLFERDFIQQFSLAVFLPLFCLAYVLKAVLLMFLYPPQGLRLFKSFGGLAGGLWVAVGLIMFIYENFAVAP